MYANILYSSAHEELKERKGKKIVKELEEGKKRERFMQQ